MVLNEIINGFLSGNIPQKKDTMFWISLLIISFTIPLSIYGYINTKEELLLYIGGGLTIGFIILWIVVFLQEEKWLKLQREKQIQSSQNMQQLFSYINTGFLLWMSEKKYLSKEVGKSISQTFYESFRKKR